VMFVQKVHVFSDFFQARKKVDIFQN